MRESAETMAENVLVPPSFKLEREVTLMPNEFRERLSAKHKNRKSSAEMSAARISRSSKHSTSKLRYSMENSYTSYHATDSEGSGSPQTEAHYVKTMTAPRQLQDSMTSPHNSFLRDKHKTLVEHHYGADHEELQSTSSHLELTGDVKFMLDNAYANIESDGGFSVRTPPQNMQIRDLIIPLDDWNNNKETIREKKYTVLPSIRNKRSTSSEETENIALSNRSSSGYSVNNQLDFFRDKIEEDADFFADFRVNTTKVAPTPRQDPLPPIQQRTAKDSKSKQNSPNQRSSYSSNTFSEMRENNEHLL